jgi:hypothetical protein
MLFGTDGDTARVSIPPNMWMPGDTIYVIEQQVVDSTVTIGGNVTTVHRDTVVNGRVQRLPIQVSRPTITLRLRMGCVSNTDPARNTCNPIRAGDRGSTAYAAIDPLSVSVVDLNRLFDQNSEVTLTGVPLQTNTRPLSKADINRIHVVPNPYVVQSEFDLIGTDRTRIDSRIRFVNVPDEGMIRIYAISGQLMQQLSWKPQDLVASGDGSPHGDLPYNLRNIKGSDLTAGLYIFVLTPQGANAGAPVARGKFVVIR